MPFEFKTKRITLRLNDGQLGWLFGVISAMGGSLLFLLLVKP